MSTLDLSSDSKRKPSEVVGDVTLSEDALALIPGSKNTLAFLSSLCAEELFNDAFLALARTLPSQYAIIWAERCVDQFLGRDPKPLEQQCVGQVRQWLSDPSDANRRAALQAAEASEFEGGCAWLAAAVGFSGGSLAPPDLAEVPPPPHLTAVAVAACLTLLAMANPDTAAETSNTAINNGLAMVAIPGASGREN